MAYTVKLTKDAKRQLDNIVYYIYFILMNPFAADSFLNDYTETLRRLSRVADGLAFCEDEELCKLNLRIIHFKTHSYKLLYHTKGSVAIIDAIYHNKQELKPPKTMVK